MNVARTRPSNRVDTTGQGAAGPIAVLAVYDLRTHRVAEYTVIQTAWFADTKTLRQAINGETARLEKKHGLPRPGVSVFEGHAGNWKAFVDFFKRELSFGPDARKVPEAETAFKELMRG